MGSSEGMTLMQQASAASNAVEQQPNMSGTVVMRIKDTGQRRDSLDGLLVVKVAVTGWGHDDIMAPPGCPHPPYDALHPQQWPL